MGKILKNFFTRFVAVFLAVFILFSSVTERYYAMDAAITYTTWQLWTMVFASLGISLERVGSLTDEERIADMEARVSEYMDSLENVESTPLEDARDFVLNIGDYVVDGALTISDSVFDILRSFVGSEVVSSSSAVVSSLPVLSGFTESQFLNLLSGLIGVSSSDSNLKSFVSALFNNIYCCIPSNDYSFFITIEAVSSSAHGTGYMLNYFEIDYGSVSIKGSDVYEYSRSQYTYSDVYFSYYSDGYTAYKNYRNSAYDSSGIYLDYGDNILMFYLDGVPFNFYDMFPSIKNGLAESINFSDYYSDCLTFSDGLVPIANSIYSGTLSDVYEKDAYDVILPGREYDDKNEEVTGDVVLPVPGSSVFDKLENGEITWEEFLEKIGAEPIDTSKGTDLLTGEYLDTQTGILEGVSSIVGFLEDFIQNLVAAFLDMLVSLVVPGEGFIESKIGDLQNKLYALGIAPYDMGDIFDDSGGNPFKDITAVINGQTVVIVSFAHLPGFLDEFRPVIRGLLVLFLLYYSINQLLSLLRLSGVMEGGNSNPIQIGLGTGTNVPQLTDRGGK